MTAPVVPPPPSASPPPPEQPGGWRQRVKISSLVFIAFMAIIGSALLITKISGFNLNNATPTALAARIATPDATTLRATRTPPPTNTPDSTLKIYITGEIKKPGVYVMRPGDRLEDAINQAGGFTDEADQTHLDLAQRVKDEMKIVVPVRATAGATPAQAGVILPGGNAGQPTSAAGAGKPTATATRTPGKINLNTASQADLESLPGIGEVLAQRIIEYRTTHGPFKTLDDLKKVQGITKATQDKIKDQVTF